MLLIVLILLVFIAFASSSTLSSTLTLTSTSTSASASALTKLDKMVNNTDYIKLLSTQIIRATKTKTRTTASGTDVLHAIIDKLRNFNASLNGYSPGLKLVKQLSVEAGMQGGGSKVDFSKYEEDVCKILDDNENLLKIVYPILTKK
jgi:hypothetical protein